MGTSELNSSVYVDCSLERHFKVNMHGHGTLGSRMPQEFCSDQDLKADAGLKCYKSNDTTAVSLKS